MSNKELSRIRPEDAKLLCSIQLLGSSSSSPPKSFSSTRSSVRKTSKKLKKKTHVKSTVPSKGHAGIEMAAEAHARRRKDRGEKVRKRRVNSAKKKKTRQPLSAFATEALERSQRDAKADNVTTDPAAQSLATNNTLTSMMARKAQTHPQGYRIPPSQLFVGSHDLDVPRICAPNYNTPPIHSFPMERTITQSPAATYLGGCPPHHSLSVSNTTGSPRPLHFGGYLPHHSPSANNISGAPIPSPFGGYPQHCLLPISKYTEAPNQSSNVSSSTNDADPMPLIFVTAFSTRPDHLRLPTSGEKRVIYHSSYDRYFLLERKEDVNLTLKDNKSWLYPIALRLSNENAYPNLSTLQTSNYK